MKSAVSLVLHSIYPPSSALLCMYFHPFSHLYFWVRREPGCNSKAPRDRGSKSTAFYAILPRMVSA
jgi:hypothetical protein